VDKTLNQLISQQPLLQSTFAVQKQWVRPEVPQFLPQSSVGSIDASVVRVTYIEPWQVDFGSKARNSSPPTFSELQGIYIANSTKALLADDSEIVKLLLGASHHGQGGILGSLVSMFADLAPPIIKVAGSALNLIPI